MASKSRQPNSRHILTGFFGAYQKSENSMTTNGRGMAEFFLVRAYEICLVNYLHLGLTISTISFAAAFEGNILTTQMTTRWIINFITDDSV